MLSRQVLLKTARLGCRTLTGQSVVLAKSRTGSAPARLRRPRTAPPAPTPPPLPSAEEAVTNLLYNTPPPGAQLPAERRVVNCLVQDEPEVLSRVSSILAARGFNIESLVVARTEISDLSRMTIVFSGQEGRVDQARRQLEDLVPVWAVLDYTGVPLIERELLLIKVSTTGHPEREVGIEEEAAPAPAGSRATDALRTTHDNIRALTELTRLFHGRVVDLTPGTCVLEVSAKSSRIDAFIRLIRPFGIIEAARSGMMAMPRSVADIYEDEHAAEEPLGIAHSVDATSLPPG